MRTHHFVKAAEMKYRNIATPKMEQLEIIQGFWIFSGSGSTTKENYSFGFGVVRDP